MLVEAATIAGRRRPIGLVIFGEGRAHKEVLHARVPATPPCPPAAAGARERAQFATILASADALLHGCEAETLRMISGRGGDPSGAPLRGARHGRGQQTSCAIPRSAPRLPTRPTWCGRYSSCQQEPARGPCTAQSTERGRAFLGTLSRLSSPRFERGRGCGKSNIALPLSWAEADGARVLLTLSNCSQDFRPETAADNSRQGSCSEPVSHCRSEDDAERRGTAPFRAAARKHPRIQGSLRTEWCGREDSNFHGLSPTTTSTLRVYQFRHDRIIDKGAEAAPAG